MKAKPTQSAALTIADELAPSAITVTPSSIQIGTRVARTLFVSTFPRYLNVGWFSPIVNLDEEFDVSIAINSEDSAATLKRLRDRLARLESEAMEEQAAGKVRNPMLETAIGDIEQLRDQLQQGTDRFFKVGIYITIYGANEKQLNDIESKVRNTLESQLVYIKQATFRMREGYFSTMPMDYDQLEILNSLNTQPLSSVFPFVSYDLTSDKGILYGVNLHNNSLVIFDRFSMENANCVIFGKSGGGKSIAGSESVLIKRNGEIKMAKIGPLIERCIAERGAQQIDEELEGVVDPGLEVWAFDKNLKGSWSTVTVAARKTAPNLLYKFTTQSGRMITTTGDHNLVTLRNCLVTVAKSSEIVVGDYVPLPRFVRSAATWNYDLNLLQLLKNSRHIYIKGASALVATWRKQLKGSVIDATYDRYLYRYAAGRPIPILYFWKIMDRIGKTAEDPIFSCLHVASRLSRTLLPIRYTITKPLVRLIGYIASEGTITGKAVIISNIDPGVISDAISSLKALGIRFFCTDRSINIGDRVFVELIKALGADGKSDIKHVAPCIFDLDRELIATYLQAYFEGDGGIEHASVSAVSKSDELIFGLCYLLYYFGIIARVKSKWKKAPAWTNKKQYWELKISGQDHLSKFASYINFVSIRKRQLLAARIRNKSANTNVDVIPGIQHIFKELSEMAPLKGIQQISVLKRGVYQPSPQQLARVIEIVEQRLQEYSHASSYVYAYLTLEDRQETVQFAHDVTTYSSGLIRARELLAQLRLFTDSDLFWDPIIKIEKIKNDKEKYVYDLTVDNEVFLAGSGGMFVHNSYTVKLEILRSLMFGSQVFVIDPENEYKHVADSVGGTQVKISISSDDHINPFDLPAARSDESPEDVLRSHVVNLAGLFRIMLGTLTPQEDSILDEALRETYAAKDITPESDFSTKTPPTMSDFQAVLSGLEGAESLMSRLKRYTEGSFSGFLNSPTNVRLDNQLVVFSIRDMEEELRPVAMYLVLNYIWTQVRTELRQRLLIVDEAWLIMKYQAGGEFLFNIAKRARKYYLGLSTISQDVSDFMSSSFGKPIVTNSSIQILLKQSPAAIDIIQETFNLTDSEKFYLLEAQVGHGLFFAGSSHVAIRILASYAEDKIITSDPRQILEIEEAKRELMQ